jgi:hypothetical protein
LPKGHALENVAVSQDVLNTWDAEARENAKQQAQNMRDTEAQAVLRAYVAASHPVVQESSTQSKRFRPLKLYARVAYFYHFSDAEMRTMHYPRFFGYVREANTILVEQQDNRVHDNGILSNPDMAALFLRQRFGKAEPYHGETVPL